MNEPPDNNLDQVRRLLANVEDTRGEALRFAVLAESTVAGLRSELDR